MLSIQQEQYLFTFELLFVVNCVHALSGMETQSKGINKLMTFGFKEAIF